MKLYDRRKYAKALEYLKINEKHEFMKDILDADSVYNWVLGNIYFQFERTALYSIGHLSKAVDLEPRCGEYQLSLGQAYSLVKENSKAKLHLRHALKYCQHYNDQLNALFYMASSHLEEKEFDDTENVLNHLLHLDPYHAGGYRLFGQLELHRKNFPKFERNMRHAYNYSFGKDRGLIAQEIAYACVRTHNFEKSLYWLANAKKIDRKNPEIDKLYGITYLRIQELKKAQKYLLKAQKSLPHDMQVNIELGVCFQALGKDKKALQLFLALDSSSKGGLFKGEIANIYRRMRNFDLSQQYYLEAQKVYPNSLKILTGLADLYRDMGDIQSHNAIHDQILKVQEKQARES
eukprot:TRINITY_DN3311_c0_g1_i7.p1 TRINITY_DN3311_c0_g1~~TRINITY_DN3311_c0_g1_i7.p1  ORF type:complete len:348 (-),score=59.65 TRINITY_DN3311_c0_g1_i7:893-1936(-)